MPIDWRDDLDWRGLPSQSAHPAAPASARTSAPPWYEVAWNPIAGCSPAGPGCEHCDAIRIVERLARMGGKGGARYVGLTRAGQSGAQWSGELRSREDLVNWPLTQRKPRRILVGSLSDLFHEQLATEIIDAVHAVMRLAHWHTFVTQTRRARRMRDYYTDPQTPARIAEQQERMAAESKPGRSTLAGAGHPGDGPAVWPLPNLLLGVSVEDQQRADRVGELLQTPAARRWACFEPLLGPVRADRIALSDGGYADALSGRRLEVDHRGRQQSLPATALPRLDWVVAGGETGSTARPTGANWVRDLRDSCAAAGVPFYFKQWGEWAPGPGNGSGDKVVRSGRRTAGRLIDGRSWDELPPELRARRPGRRRARG
jgi:protein gp37